MRALGGRDSTLVATIEPNGIQLTLQRRRFRRSEVKRLIFGVAALDATHHPRPFGDLVYQLARIVVAIEMLITVAIGEPEELVRVRRERHHVVYAGDRKSVV